MENRLTDLEIKFSFAQDLLDELNRTVYRQQQQIDLLQQEMRLLQDQVQNQVQYASQDHTSQDQRPMNLGGELPPHY
ncbi:MAG: SlyX family protein [Azovibrio sp.]|uniref:SlyX family protein n=1 Tax=Azovibrio sp. TaxID=1872673 RepID=UPI003C74E9DE